MFSCTLQQLLNTTVVENIGVDYVAQSTEQCGINYSVITAKCFFLQPKIAICCSNHSFIKTDLHQQTRTKATIMIYSCLPLNMPHNICQFCGTSITCTRHPAAVLQGMFYVSKIELVWRSQQDDDWHLLCFYHISNAITIYINFVNIWTLLFNKTITTYLINTCTHTHTHTHSVLTPIFLFPRFSGTHN